MMVDGEEEQVSEQNVKQAFRIASNKTCHATGNNTLCMPSSS